MKIYLMTDMEGCAGILNSVDWVLPQGRWYAKGLSILTGEANAVIAGLFEGGADEVVVFDGHGPGGLDPLALDPRAQLVRGPLDYPLCLDGSFAGACWVGQHAKAGTPYSHLSHTGGFNRVDESINGISIGEYGAVALCAREGGVPCIFAGGEEALAREAEALTPGVVTVSVKRGLLADGLDHLSAEEYAQAKLGAIHLSHAEACRRLAAGSAAAMRQLRQEPMTFRHPELKPPYVRVARYRAQGGKPPYTVRAEHPSSVIGVLNAPLVPA